MPLLAAGFIGAAGFLALGRVKPVPHTHNAAWEAATQQQLFAWPKESGGTVAINPSTTNPQMK